MVLNPCLHLVFVSERKLTSIIAYTVLTSDVLFSAVHLFGYMENTITTWGYYGEFLFLHLRLCRPDSMFCHGLGINVGSFWPPPSCLLCSGHGGLNRAHFSYINIVYIALSTSSFHHLVSGFHWWFFEILQTSVAASSKGPFSFDQAQTSHLSVYIRRNPFFNHFLRGISVFGYYPYFSVFCINCRLINRNPQLTLCSWTVPRTHAWAGTIVRPLPGELRPRGPIHVTPLGSIITNTATPLRNIESAQCRMRRHRIPV